ncbi:hypothetical protein [Streptomyces aureus]|uniref:hypothetical protein n=1 Tax=Streptomyces aureus TaxID=193461 RepID=UPI0036BCAE3B
MTAHSDEPEPGGPIDRELTRGHEAFTAKVEAALDVEAGLRDILFQSRHEAFTAKVETALDVEAGLRDILTPPTIQAPPGVPPVVAPPVVNAAPGGMRWQASPAQRLKLRSNPRVAAASSVLNFVGAWASASPPNRNLIRVLDLVRAGDRDLAIACEHVRPLDRDLASAFDCARALDCAHYLDRDFDFDLDPNCRLLSVLARAHTLACAFVLTCELAADLDLDRAHDFLDVLYRARVRDLARPCELARDLDRARHRARGLAIELVRARNLAPGIGRDLARGRARGLARGLAGDLASDLVSDLDRARYWCLEIINNEYTQAIGAPVAADKESLASLMDDFTTDDLSDADVREDDIKLTGVRWSDGTTWPASTDIERLKRRSDRQEDGSWIIRTGTGNVRNDALT